MECVSKDTIEVIVEPGEPVVMNKCRNPRRFNSDGSINTKPLDPDLFKNYYIEKLKGVNVICTNCGISAPKPHIARHMKSLKCKKNSIVQSEVSAAS